LPRRKGRGSGFEIRVANLYRKGGYSVERNRIINGHEFDVLAKRKRERPLVVEAKNWKKSPIHSGVIRDLVSKARSVGGKPVLAIPKSSTLTKPARNLAKRKGVRIKRV